MNKCDSCDDKVKNIEPIIGATINGDKFCSEECLNEHINKLIPEERKKMGIHNHICFFCMKVFECPTLHYYCLDDDDIYYGRTLMGNQFMCTACFEEGSTEPFSSDGNSGIDEIPDDDIIEY